MKLDDNVSSALSLKEDPDSIEKNRSLLLSLVVVKVVLVPDVSLRDCSTLELFSCAASSAIIPTSGYSFPYSTALLDTIPSEPE